MMKKLIAALVAAIFPTPVQRYKVRDSYSAFTFRMPAGFPGDINRTHPAEVEFTQIDETYPIVLYGNMGVLDGTSHALRKIVAADQSDSVDLKPFGAAVRPYPVQQSSGGMTSSIGASVPPTEGGLDAMRMGFIMAQLNTGVTAPVKGGRVYVWAAATSGNHIQGGYETEASAGNTVRLTPEFTYNGPADSNGVTEISCGF